MTKSVGKPPRARVFVLSYAVAALCAAVVLVGTAPSQAQQQQPQLSATIHDEPVAHQETDFTFELWFSEDFTISYRTLRDYAFDVTGGEVLNARRLVRGQNRRWEITVRPSSNAQVTIELPATTDCAATGAICTPDLRMLTAVPAFVVLGPSQVTLSDNDPVEGAAVTASLSDPDDAAVTPTWQWARSGRPDGGFSDINDPENGSNTATYTPQEDDDAHFLKATARYRDGEGTDKVVDAVTRLPVGVTEITLVSNTGQLPHYQNLVHSGASSYQGFVTGDNPAGYALTAAGVRFGVTVVDRDCYTVTPPWVWLWSGMESQDRPDRHLLELPRPETAVRDTVVVYDARRGVVLDPSTTYYLRLRDGSCISISYSTVEESDGAPGWSIADVRLRANDILAPSRFAVSNLNVMMDIRGVELLGVPGTPQSVSAQPGPGSLTVSWLAPGSTGQRAVTKYQVRHKRAAEADFGQWADVGDGDDVGTDVDDERSTTLSSLATGEQFAVQVRAVNAMGGGTVAEVKAAPANTVPVQRNSAAAGAPTTLGDAVVGETLTASTRGITDSDGLDDVVYAYQWLADDTPIADATASSYKLTSAEEGKTIKVRVSFTDDLGNGESLISAATQAVKPLLSASVHDEPGSHDGSDFTFELRFSEDFYISYRTLRDHAFAVSGGEVVNARRLVHGKSRRWEITVSPASQAAVSIELPATTDCAATGALCTVDQRMLTAVPVLVVPGPVQSETQSETQTETQQQTPKVKPPLTATVHDEPGSHDGSDFTFELRFSEDFPISYRTLRDHAFAVSGGEVVNARRLVHGKSRRWEITVSPASSAQVSIELPATTDCAAAAAICTADQRMLSSQVSIQVAGPAS